MSKRCVYGGWAPHALLMILPSKQVNLSFPLHPSLQRAYDDVLLDAWVNVRCLQFVWLFGS